MDDTPLPEPRGALVPPRRVPPTAVGVAPPPPPRPYERVPAQRPFLRRLLSACFDVLDHFGDDIAHALRLR